MKQEHIDRIKGYYDMEGEFKQNDRYSGEQGTVYTKNGDRYYWLVLEQKSGNRLEVRQTDAQGRITARDSYEIARNTVKCMAVERLSAEGMVSFNPDEINLIYQFGEKGREGALASLRDVEPVIADGATRKIVGGTMQKMSGLSEASCGKLISSTKNRKLAESDCSIRERLAKVEKQLKNCQLEEKA